MIQSALFLTRAQNALERGVGIAELIAAVLFVVPSTLRVGAAALLLIFVLVTVVHGGHDTIGLIYPALLVVLIATTTASKKSTAHE